MLKIPHAYGLILALATAASAAGTESLAPFSPDTNQVLERTCFQTSAAWSPQGNLGSDVAIVYGIDTNLPARMQTWREHGYRLHVMTGVAWGEYQDYLYGRFDGINHEDEAQTERDGRKIGHGGDVYYMCPGTNYGKFLCVGVQRALDAGAEAIHLEEPEFWDRAGYSEGFKREWRNYYHEDWQPPDSSVDARWRAGKLKYFLYRRALQQVFDFVQAYDRRTGRHVRCYVPTHSLLNYAQWCIVSPESSLAQLSGCDGYIAQVWTGTSREPNRFRGEVRSRTFATAFLEYGAMQNLVRATGRSVWYLNDPIEDNPDHDWGDYRRNWESTLTASLFQPAVSQFEVVPWPERVFGGRYPRPAEPEKREPIPPAYATELQTVFNALNNLKPSRAEWDCGTPGVGVLVSDSLMFQRGQPTPSDPYLGNVYGLAMPLLQQGLPVMPVQLENVVIPNYLDSFRVLLLSYDGQKPLSPAVHAPLVAWVKGGGTLVFCDRDADPYLKVRDWWNSGGNDFATPREPLFALLGLDQAVVPDQYHPVGQGGVIWLRERPVDFSTSAEGAAKVVTATRLAAEKASLKWRETNYLLLRRGPYCIAAGLDESGDREPHALAGRFVNLFDAQLRVQNDVSIVPGSRWFLLDLGAVHAGRPQLLAAACKTVLRQETRDQISYSVEGVGGTPAIVLLAADQAPQAVTLAGMAVTNFEYSAKEHLLWIRFDNTTAPRELEIRGIGSASNTNDAGALFNAYAKAFYAVDGTNGYFKNDQAGGVADFWKQAEEIEGVLDACEWTGNTNQQVMAVNLLNGFEKEHGTNWTANHFNDDCMWASIAFARGYLMSGNPRFRDVARWNFDRVYARAWDTNLSGGLYWTTDNQSKNACANGPAGIAAWLLYQAGGGGGYQTKAGNIYQWERSVLFHSDTGAVADGIGLDGHIHAWASTYNQGTFIGLANFLGQTNDAMLAANYTRDHLTDSGMLPQYGVAGNNSGFNAIFIRWLARFMRDRGLESIYQSWLQDNADAAWKVRRPLDGLSWCQWREATPNETRLCSWDCIASLEALAVSSPNTSANSVANRLKQ